MSDQSGLSGLDLERGSQRETGTHGGPHVSGVGLRPAPPRRTRVLLAAGFPRDRARCGRALLNGDKAHGRNERPTGNGRTKRTRRRRNASKATAPVARVLNVCGFKPTPGGPDRRCPGRVSRSPRGAKHGAEPHAAQGPRAGSRRAHRRAAGTWRPASAGSSIPAGGGSPRQPVLTGERVASSATSRRPWPRRRGTAVDEGNSSKGSRTAGRVSSGRVASAAPGRGKPART